ncbi:MAG TPA: glycoside hydrolase family 18 protein [Clostridia bacterium]|nr:glycoside hydrolase family 18 protein [Clostridia bacterium]
MDGYKIIGYLADWADWTAEDVDAQKLTHINYAFATIDDGRVVAKVLDRRLGKLHILKEIKAQNPHLKTLISVGGWGADGFSDAALTEESRELFADTAVKFMKDYGFDGVDIDWEYPCSSAAGIVSRPEDKENFTLMLEELRQQLDREGEQDGRHYLLTIAVGAGQYFIDGSEMGKIQKYLDFVNIMTYDYANGLDEHTGHHTHLFESKVTPGSSSDKSVRLFMGQGIPASKLVLGVAFYGRAWSGVSGENNGLGMGGIPGAGGLDTSYTNLSSNLVDKNGFDRYWDEDAKAPYLYNGDIFISYDDEESIGHKVDYIKETGLGGVMFWEYSSDKSGALLKKLYEGLRS